MIHKNILFFLFFVSTIYLTAQVKPIEGDTAFWYRFQKKKLKDLTLKSFETSKDEFNFRFRQNDQILEFTRNKDSLEGRLINYLSFTRSRWPRNSSVLSILRLNRLIYRNKKEKSQLVFEEILLESDQLERINKILIESKLEEIPTDKLIEDWADGTDGNTYFFEFSTPEMYLYKNYWSPNSIYNDTLKEAKRINRFKNSLDSIVFLDSTKQLFWKKQYRIGTYSSDGTVQMNVYQYKSLGYHGSTKLPFGYTAEFHRSFLFKKKLRIGGKIEHKFDGQENHDLLLQGYDNIILLNRESYKDFIIGEYRYRRLDFLSTSNDYRNYSFIYGVAHKRINLGGGIDYLLAENTETAARLYFFRKFLKPKLGFTMVASVFEKRIDYRISINRQIKFKSFRKTNFLNLTFGFEKFRSYYDVNFGLSKLF